MPYFILGIILVFILHRLLRTAKHMPPEKREHLKHWTLHGLKWSAFLIAARYFPGLWFFMRPPQYRPYNKATQSTRTTMSEQEARAVLKVSPVASKSEIKHAYRQQMRANHPDTGGSVDAAIRLNQARDVLLKKTKL